MIADRVQAATATTGTGTITPGAAVTGFRTFAQGYATNVSNIPLLITDGSAWEISRSVFNRSANTLTRTLVASSTGALLNLSGSAIVGVTSLAGDQPAYWPKLSVGREGGGTALISLRRNDGFTTMPLSTAPVIDTHGGFNTSTYRWTVPVGQSGIYSAAGKVRPMDDAAANETAQANYGIGVDVANIEDTSFFNWEVFPKGVAGASARHTGNCIRLIQLTEGQQVRLYAYLDFVNTAGIKNISLDLNRIG